MQGENNNGPNERNIGKNSNFAAVRQREQGNKILNE
jgi:hypothetical protein